MNKHLIKKYLIRIFIFKQILLGGIFFMNYTFASEIENEPTSEYLKKQDKFNFYILGSGDVLKLEVTERTFDLNNIYTIDGEGYLNLKRLKKIYVSGLTLEELTNILNKEYSTYVKRPDVKILVVNYRPIQFYIDGEIENPGVHILPGAINSTIKTNDNSTFDESSEQSNLETRSVFSSGELIETQLKKDSYFPTLIDVIRQSGGITSNADLTKIRVERINSISNGAGKIGADINLMKSLSLEDNSQNIRIFDGDTIFVAYSKEPALSQISKAIKSNLNPKFTNVLIGGNVDKPGKLTLSRKSVLNDAVLISAGTKSMKGPITFIRNNNDGTIEERRFRLKLTAKRGTYKNPYLRNGDIIILNNNLFSTTSNILNEVTAPITGITRGYVFYKLLKD